MIRDTLRGIEPVEAAFRLKENSWFFPKGCNFATAGNRMVLPESSTFDRWTGREGDGAAGMRGII
jgi:hypothetical protein